MPGAWEPKTLLLPPPRQADRWDERAAGTRLALSTAGAGTLFALILGILTWGGGLVLLGYVVALTAVGSRLVVRRDVT